MWDFLSILLHSGFSQSIWYVVPGKTIILDIVVMVIWVSKNRYWDLTFRGWDWLRFWKDSQEWEGQTLQPDLLLPLRIRRDSEETSAQKVSYNEGHETGVWGHLVEQKERGRSYMLTDRSGMWVIKGCLLELGVGTKQQMRRGWLERKGPCIHRNCLLVLEAWILESVGGRNVEEEHLWEPLELWSERKGRREQVFCYRFKNETWDRYWRLKRRGESLTSAYLLPWQ